MAYEMHCTNCMRKWIIDDPAFDQLVQSIEESAGKMSDVLCVHKVPVSYKSHCHVFPILNALMRCCAEPEISLIAEAGGQEPPLKDIADAPCPECGAHAVSFADDLAFDEMILGTQGVVSVNIPDLTGIRCSNCRDYAFDADASKKIMQAIEEVESRVQEPQGKEMGAGE